MLHPGQRLGDRYRLDTRIGAGGMGEVWRAHDEVLGRVVAVKAMLPEVAGEPDFARRFLAEAKAMASVNHPAVASIHDYGHTATITYLVMEFIDGESLSQVLGRVGRLAPADTMWLIAQAADGLQAVHDRGIVHRDIKPANLLIRRNGTLLITDFGISRAHDGTSLTVSGAVLGTPNYISPEQVLGQPATARSDLYSLGLTAYECLAGHRPFAGDNPYAVALQRLQTPPRTLGGNIPRAVLAVVENALATDPADRWPTAAALAQAAREAAQGLSMGRSAPTVSGPGPTPDQPLSAGPSSHGSASGPQPYGSASGPPSLGTPPGGQPAHGYPSGPPSLGTPPGGQPSHGYPSRGGHPGHGYPSGPPSQGGQPSHGYPSGPPSLGTPPGGQPSHGYPSQGGQPSHGYPFQGGQPGHGYPSGPPSPGTPPGGQPAHGSPSPGTPPGGHPAHGYPSSGPPSFGSGAGGPDAFGSGAFGPPSSGPNAFGSGAFGPPSSGPNAFGSGAFGPPSTGSPPYGSGPYGSGPYGPAAPGVRPAGPEPTRRRPWLVPVLAAIAVAVVLAGGASAWWALDGDKGSGAAAAPDTGQSSGAAVPEAADLPAGFAVCGEMLCPSLPMCWRGLNQFSGYAQPPGRADCAEPHYQETFAAIPMPSGIADETVTEQVIANEKVRAACTAEVMASRSRDGAATKGWTRSPWPVQDEKTKAWFVYCMASSDEGETTGSAFKPA